MTRHDASRDRARFGAAMDPRWGILLLTALAYWAAGRIGLMLAIPPGYATVVWPPAGIAIAAAIRGGPAGLAGVALGAFAVNLSSGTDGLTLVTVALAGAIAVGSTLQAATAAYLARRFSAFPYAAATPLGFARFFCLSGLVACLVAASFGHVALIGFGKLTWAQAPRSFATWWGGDAAGVAIFAPVLLAFDGPTVSARLRRGVPVFSAAMSAFAAIFALVWIDVASGERGVQADFDLLSRELASRVEATVSLGQHAVEGLAGDFVTPHARDLPDFKPLAERLAAFGLGIQALEWIPRVAEADRANYESAMSSQWGKPFRIFERRDGKPVDAAGRPDYFPVGFVTPLKGNEGAVGFDLASNPARKAALLKARDSGATIASAGVKLVQNNAMGALLFTPVYQQDAPIATVEQRRAALKGFALGVFSAPDLLAVALRAADTTTLDYWLIDDTDPATPITLASDATGAPHDFKMSSSAPFAVPLSLGQHMHIRVADRQWTFALAPTAAYVAKHMDASAYWLLIGGLLLTALGVGCVLVVVDRQLDLVDSRERDLENQKFALDQHAIVSITDRRGIISYANDRFCQVSGHPRERLLGANHNIVSSGKHDDAFYARLWATLNAGEVWRGEICNRNAEGGFYWLDATLVPLTGRRGEIDKFIAICTDITARKHLEQDLESSRAFLQNVTDSMGEGVYTIDREGRCTFLNAEAERLLGWRFEEVRGEVLHKLVHFQDAEGSPIPACDCAIHNGVKQSGEYRSEDQVFTHRDGRVFPVSVVAAPIERDGRAAGAVVVFQDITERRRVLEELEESEQRLSVALSASSTGLWDYDPIRDRSIYSDTWFRMLGYEPRKGAQAGEVFFSLLHPDDMPRYRETMESHEAGESAAIEVEFRMKRADGEWAWIRSIGKIIERDAAGRPQRLIGVHIDTTSTHLVQTELADAKDVAVRASQAKSDFLATMSHEIRTPMNAIIGLSHLLARTQLNARQRDYLVKVQNASQSLLGIINDILDFSKIEAGKLTIEAVDFELDKVLDGVVAVIAPKISEKGLKLIVDRDPTLPADLIGDPLRLSQLLTNLLSNATKFTARGEVRIRLSGAATPDGRFRLVVAVADSGIGMSAAQMASLFRPFTQADASTSRRFGGTGLGLAICRQIANLMGGDISVESVEGVGSTFTFHVDFRIGAPAKLAEQERAALAGRRVLAVDDSKATRHMLRATLAEWGVEVTEAASGFEALQLVAEGGAFDFLLLDWKLPDIDGVETLARLREAGFDAPALMLTAYGRSELAEALARRFEDGANVIDAMDKPISPRQLKERALAAFGGPSGASVGADRQARHASDVLLPDVRILLVEDNPINQQVATELLEALGVETTVAGSGEEALEILSTRSFDLILMDMQMPGKDGLETTIAIRTEIGDTRTPIVAMTANAMSGDRERCLEAGMNDHIGKPVDPDRLALTLAHWLEGRARTTAPRPAEPTPQDTGQPAIAGVDVEFALRNLGGNAELFAQLMEIFVEEHEHQAQAIARAAGAGEWKRVNALAHGLKGAAATLGAMSVSELARQIEHGAREEAPDEESIGLQAETLGFAIAEVVAGFAASRPQAVKETQEPEEAPPTALELLPAIDDLARLLDAGDADAEPESERLADRLAHTGAATRAAAIANAASRFDFKVASAALADLRAEVSGWN